MWTTTRASGCACLLAGGLLAACAPRSSAPAVAPTDGPPISGDADTTAELQRRLEALVAPYVDPAGVPGKAVGMVVGVSAGGVRLFVDAGATTVNGATRATADTIFEIGSVTKIYTGVLLGLELNRGHLLLADLIDPYFPAGAPSYGARAISLVDLATHTAGLPGMPTNLHGTPANPAAGYTAEDLASFMAAYTLTVEPGTTFRYSNLGAGTLGHVLVGETGSLDYEALVKRELATPLAAPDTTVVLSTEQQARSARGHRNGQPAPANDIGAPLQGSGALRATGDDALRFVEAALGAGPPEIVAAWQRALEPQRPSAFGENGRTGLLVNLEDLDGRTVYSKNGQTAGFSAQVLFTTAPAAAVIVLANCSELVESGELRTLGLALLAELLP